MRSYRMLIAYDGTAYSGWQVQPGRVTIQEVLESALRRVVGQPIRVVASGRTDAGVHALGQVVSFRCTTRLGPDVFCRALEANTPDDICVREVAYATDDFHAIRAAISKHYRYVVVDGPNRDLFLRSYAWHVRQALDVPRMCRAASILVGRHDFRSFEAAGAPRKTSVRTVSRLDVARVNREMSQPIVFDIEADGFLYNMVRNIVGSLVLIGRHRKRVEWLRDVLQATDRTMAGPTAPAHGLTLVEVRYADSGAGEGRKT